MKKILCLTAALLLTASTAFAERFFEFGMDVFVQADESLIGINECFVDELVIDLPAIADSMNDDGFVVDVMLEPRVYTNFLINGWGVGLSCKVDGYMNFGIGKKFWEFLAYGNELDDSVEVSVKAGAELYAEVAAPLNFRLGQLQFTVTPSVFAPVVYIPNPNATVTVTTASDGTMTATGVATYTVYSAVDLSKIFTGNWQPREDFTAQSLLDDLNREILETVGFDINAEVTYPMLSFLTIGGYVHVPIIPGRMHHSATQTATASGQLDAILDSFSSGGSVNPTYETEFSDLVFGSETYTVNRPMRFGAMAKIAIPFIGNLTVIPKVGYCTRNPFSEDYDFMANSTLEYSLGVNYSLLNMLNLSLTHEYWNQVFSNYAGLSLNVRVAQVNVLIGTSGTSFSEAFKIYGLKAKVGICVGI